MSTQITNYQCPACTGPLHFDEQTGKLQCDYCESTFTVDEVEALYAEKNAAAETAGEEPKPSEWGEDEGKMRSYNCPSCGAELICEETTAATACPYCGNPTIVPMQFDGALKPRYVLPFQLKKEEAVSRLQQFYKGKPFVPKAFTETNHIEEIKATA